MVLFLLVCLLCVIVSRYIFAVMLGGFKDAGVQKVMRIESN